MAAGIEGADGPDQGHERDPGADPQSAQAPSAPDDGEETLNAERPDAVGAPGTGGTDGTDGTGATDSAEGGRSGREGEVTRDHAGEPHPRDSHLVPPPEALTPPAEGSTLGIDDTDSALSHEDVATDAE